MNLPTETLVGELAVVAEPAGITGSTFTEIFRMWRTEVIADVSQGLITDEDPDELAVSIEASDLPDEAYAEMERRYENEDRHTENADKDPSWQLGRKD